MGHWYKSVEDVRCQSIRLTVRVSYPSTGLGEEIIDQ